MENKKMEPNLSSRKNLVTISKTLSHALRHAPWLYELELDEEGWTPLEHVLDAIREKKPYWSKLNVEHIQEIIETSSKKRYELKPGYIRALYGHSIKQTISKTPVAPPVILYHGTNPQTVRLIEKSGLLPMGRQYVHCSTDKETAKQVGQRKSNRPVLLEIYALTAHDAGVNFYHGNESIWLADAVPPEHIKFPFGNLKVE